MAPNARGRFRSAGDPHDGRRASPVRRAAATPRRSPTPVGRPERVYTDAPPQGRTSGAVAVRLRDIQGASRLGVERAARDDGSGNDARCIRRCRARSRGPGGGRGDATQIDATAFRRHEERSPMTTQPTTPPNELMDEVAALARERVSREELNLVLAFVTEYYAGVSPDDLAERKTDESLRRRRGAPEPGRGAVHREYRRSGSTTPGSSSTAGSRPIPSSKSLPTTCRS